MKFLIFFGIINIFGILEARAKISNIKEDLYKSKSGGRKIYILVDLDIYDDISSAINQYIIDLEDDGYEPTLRKFNPLISKKEFSLIDPVKKRAKEIRDTLQNAYNNGIEGAIFITDGDIVSPPWENGYPCDYYYMDLDGQWGWSEDQLVNHYGEVDPEIYVGRIFPHRSNGDDVTLINDYFERNHDIRSGYLNFSLSNKYVALGFYDEAAMKHKSKGHETALYPAFSNVDVWEWKGPGYEDSTTKEYYAPIDPEAFSVLKQEYEVVSVTCHGNEEHQQLFDSYQNPEWVTRTNIVNHNRCFFFELNSCYSCNFYEPDYLASFYLFGDPNSYPENTWKSVGVLGYSESTDLGSSTIDFYETAGWGFNFGNAFLRFLSKLNLNGRYNMHLLADPTLKLYGYIYGLSEVSGFPTTNSSYKGAIFIDLDLDGTDEILKYSESEVTLTELDGTEKWSYNNFSANRIYKPAIEDFKNNDGKLEIIFGYCKFGKGYVLCLNDEGEQILQIECANMITKSPALFDINNDDKVEIILSLEKIPEKSKSSQKILQIFDDSGNELWSYNGINTIQKASGISIGDLNGEDLYGITFALDGTVDSVHVAYYQNGNFYILWKKELGEQGTPNVSFGDVDQDGDDDILVSNSKRLRIFKGESGELLSSYNCNDVIKYSQFVQIDPFSTSLEILASTVDGWVKSYEYESGPLEVNKRLPKWAESTSSVGDFGGTGTFELIIPGRRGIFFTDPHGHSVWDGGDFAGFGALGGGMVTDVEGDGLVEYGYIDFLGQIHLQPLDYQISNFSWLESYADRWNTSNHSDYVPPIPPHGLTGTSTPYDPRRNLWKVDLNWEDNKDLDLSNYKVYEKKPGSSTYQHVGSPSSSQFSRIVRAFAGQDFYYHVKAVDESDNEGSRSNIKKIRIGTETKGVNKELAIEFKNGDILIHNLDNYKNSKDIEIYDYIGRMVKKIQPDRIASFLKISVRDLPTGIYFIRVGQGKSAIVNKLVIFR